MARTRGLLPNSPKEWRLLVALGPLLLFAACFYAVQGDEVTWPVAIGAWVSGVYVFFHAGVHYSRRLRDLGRGSRLPWLRDASAASADARRVVDRSNVETPPNPTKHWRAVAVAGIVGTPLWIYESAMDHHVRVGLLAICIAGALFTAGALYERRLVELGKDSALAGLRDNRHKV